MKLEKPKQNYEENEENSTKTIETSEEYSEIRILEEYW